MPTHQDGKKRPASIEADVSAEQDTALDRDDGLEAVKPHLTGMIGIHIESPAEDAATGSPGADVDRDLARD
ncbi:MAG: hypothetical protein V4517_16480 [Pseudomonadota bacterium]